jgi:hypothetical protein
MSCMQEMLRVNIRQNLQVVIQIATKYSDILGPVQLIEMFESFKTFEGISVACDKSEWSASANYNTRPLLLSWIHR